MEDALQQYAIGLDADDFDKVREALDQAQTDEGLESAIFALHARFDSNESYINQVQQVRDSLQKEQTPTHKIFLKGECHSLPSERL